MKTKLLFISITIVLTAAACGENEEKQIDAKPTKDAKISEVVEQEKPKAETQEKTTSVYKEVDCATLLTVEDVKAKTGLEIKYRISNFENGEPGSSTCVREFSMKGSGRVIMMVSNYDNDVHANGYWGVSNEGEKSLEGVGDMAKTHERKSDVMGNSYSAVLRIGNTIVELKYTHGKRDKAILNMDGVIELLKVIEGRLKEV